MSDGEFLKIRESDLDDLIEIKIREQMKGNKVKDESETHKKGSESISRREFLKKAGLGTLGLGALLSPVSALDVRSNDFSVITSSDSATLVEGFSVDENQDVKIPNGALYVQGDSVVTSSTKSYDIQKNGADAEGVINFKTS